MWLKKFCKVLVCMVVAVYLGTTAWAADGIALLETLEHETPGIIEPAELNNGVSARASGSFSTTISANSIKGIGEDVFLDAGETVTFDCTYSPARASIDFGLIAPDGCFYFINVTSGGINKTIQVEGRGYYTLAVRNNSSSEVTVTGTVQY